MNIGYIARIVLGNFFFCLILVLVKLLATLPGKITLALKLLAALPGVWKKCCETYWLLCQVFGRNAVKLIG